jgi:hypothetical protein
MLNVRIEGNKALIDGLNRLAAAGVPKAVERGLVRIGAGVYREALYWLSGSGGASKKARTDYAGFTNKSGKEVMFRSYQGAGGYPVPKRTGHLSRQLDWLKPGESKSGDVGAFTAGKNEVVIFNSAGYADAIHEGKGSSAKFGPRRYMTDGLERFNAGDAMKRIMEEEISKEIE